MKRATIIAVILAAACGGPPKKMQPQDHTPPPPPPPVEKDKPMPPPPPPIATQTAAPQDLKFPDEEFRRTQPGPSEQRPFRLPKMKPFALKNGIQVYLVEQHALPIVSMQLEFDGGGLVDPPGKDGLASVCMAMLTEGTEKLDKIQYAEALADIASSVNASASDDAVHLSLSSLTKHLEATYQLFVDTLRTPGMRDSDFKRMIHRRIESVKQARTNPSAIPGRVNETILYGAKHPRGGVVTETSLQAITLEDCKKFAGTWLKPQHARLYVVGDQTEEQVRSRFEGAELASWKGATPRPPALPAAKTMKGRIFFVNVPNAAQSQVWLMGFGPKRNAPDYFDTTIASAVFGGGFSSRINMNLREDKGYSYGARGGFQYNKQDSELVVSSAVRSDATYQTVLEIDREVKELHGGKTPATADEIDREKTGAILALPGRFATAQAALGQYRGLIYYGLPLDYYDHYVANVGKVTDKLVKAAAAKHLDPRDAVYLVVGDGDAKMILHNEKAEKTAPAAEKDRPFMKDGKAVTLREALIDLARRGDVGAGGFVELDPDGKPLK